MNAEKPLARPDEPKPVWKLLITGSPRLLNAHRQGLRSRCAQRTPGIPGGDYHN